MLRRLSIPLLTVLVLAFSITSCAHRAPEPAPPEEDSTPRLYSFFPLPPALPRIQFLTQFSVIGEIVEAEEVKPSFFESFLFGELEEVERIPVPAKTYGIAAKNGKVYVTDTKEARVIVYDLANGRQYAMVTEGLGKLSKPVDLFIEPEGYIFIADIGRQAIIVYDSDERYVSSFGKPGQFQPTSVYVHGDELFVADVQDNEVEVLDRRTGELKRKFGGVGQEDGHFNAPTSLAVSKKGDVYVTDTFNFRVQKFDIRGKQLVTIGAAGAVLGSFTRPKGLEVTPDGVLYVIDAAFEVVQLFNEEGRILTSFGGGDQLALPARIAYDPYNVQFFSEFIHPDFEVEYLLYVTNTIGLRKVSVYGFGHLKDPSKPIGFEELEPVPDDSEGEPGLPELTPDAVEPIESVEP